MSEFLGRLLARTRDEADVIRPRLPGRFEPVRTEGTLEAVETADAHPQESPPAVPIPRRRQVAEEPVEERRPVHRGRLTDEPRMAEEPSPRRPSAAPRATYAERTASHRVPPPRETVRQPESQSRSEPALPEPKPTRRVASTRSPVIPDPVRVRDDNDVRRVSEEPPPTPHPIARPNAEPTRVEPASVRPRLPQNESRDVDDEPVIRIHIGRIDVRATHEAPPTPARPARPEPKRLTLEEYARERGRGER